MDVMPGCVSVLRSNENTISAELELSRIINNIQELLYSASDISHDRCVKVLTARAKVGLSPPRLTSADQGGLFSTRT